MYTLYTATEQGSSRVCYSVYNHTLSRFYCWDYSIDGALKYAKLSRISSVYDGYASTRRTMLEFPSLDTINNTNPELFV